MKLEYPPGATPLDEDEIAELIPSHITTQGELNQWEQTNIHQAQEWLMRSKKDILNEKTLLALHKQMFNKTWKWSGKFRNSNKNIGVDKAIIAMELRILLDDVKYQIEKEVYDFDEITTRFHHCLVLIHPFPNGNGRHARMATDYLRIINNKPKFTWGRDDLVEANETRKRYIECLRQADKRNYEPLLEFVRL